MVSRGDRLGALYGARASGVIFEVFRQEREGQPFQHGGALEAPNLTFAEAYAREFYGRRDESFALWVVPRGAIEEVREPYVADVFDRDYRRVDGYSLKVKLKEARERVEAGHAWPAEGEEA
jgi:phenylacetate-CoA oxygenase PaaH subunit